MTALVFSSFWSSVSSLDRWELRFFYWAPLHLQHSGNLRILRHKIHAKFYFPKSNAQGSNIYRERWQRNKAGNKAIVNFFGEISKP